MTCNLGSFFPPSLYIIILLHLSFIIFALKIHRPPKLATHVTTCLYNIDTNMQCKAYLKKKSI